MFDMTVPILPDRQTKIEDSKYKLASGQWLESSASSLRIEMRLPITANLLTNYSIPAFGHLIVVTRYLIDVSATLYHDLVLKTILYQH